MKRIVHLALGLCALAVAVILFWLGRFGIGMIAHMFSCLEIGLAIAGGRKSDSELYLVNWRNVKSVNFWVLVGCAFMYIFADGLSSVIVKIAN